MLDEQDNPDAAAESGDSADARVERLKQLNRVVCICKGIPLSRILPALDGAETVAEVNARTGSGTGGCRGERCGPRIKILLRKKKEQKQK